MVSTFSIKIIAYAECHEQAIFLSPQEFFQHKLLKKKQQKKTTQKAVESSLEGYKVQINTLLVISSNKCKEHSTKRVLPINVTIRRYT